MGSKNVCCSLFAILFMCSLIAGVDASPGSVTRAISPSAAQPGQEVTVTLDVKVSPGERYYLIDEAPPSGLEIMDPGDLVVDKQGHLKIVMLQNAADVSYEYILKAPDADGAYSFSGIYQIDGMEQPEDLAGDSSLRISTSSVDVPFTAIMAIAVVAIVIILAAVLLKRSKNS